MLVREKIKFLRLRANLTQEELGKEMLYSRSYIAKVESTEETLSETAQAAFANYFKVSSDYIKNELPCERREKELISIWKKLLIHQEKEVKTSALTESIKNSEQELQANLLLATYHFKTAHYEEALKVKASYIDNYLSIVQKSYLSLYTQQLLLYFEINFCKFEDKYEEGINLCKQLLTVILIEFRLTIELLLVFFYLKNENTEKAFQQISEVNSARLENDELLAEYYNYLAVIYRRLGFFEKAFETLDKLEEVALRSNLTERLAFVYHNKGVIYGKDKQDYENALNYYYKGLNVFESPNHQGNFYRCILTVLIKLERYAEAKTIIEASETIKINKETEMGILLLKGELALYCGDIEKHRYYHQLTLNYFLSQKDSDTLSYIFNYLADYYQKNNKFKKALEFHKRKEELKLAYN